MPAQAAGPASKIRIVAYGDSLTAGFNLPAAAAFPAQLQAALEAKGHAVEVINAGVSGDTTAAGLERFDWAVPDGVEGAILELGANDALRGLDPAKAEANLDAIITKLKARGIEVVIAGMAAPRNWGPEYAAKFDGMFAALAAKHGAILYPFFLEGIAMRADLNQSDGLHPTSKGVAVIVERMLPTAERLLGRIREKRAAKG